MKDMTFEGLKDFITRHMLVTYLVLLPSGLGVVISILNIVVPQSLLSLSVFCTQLIFVILGTAFMYRKSEEQEPIKFSRKLDVFVEKFVTKIVNPAYVYSLPSIALEIAGNRDVVSTQAWSHLLMNLSENLTNNTIALRERIKVDKKQFRTHLNDFRQVLSSLRELKTSFYNMIPEVRHPTTHYSSSEFRKQYDRAYEEYNRCMDEIKIFSNEIKVSFAESIDENLTEHVKGFEELFPKTPIAQPH
jgi:hypothetical protein